MKSWAGSVTSTKIAKWLEKLPGSPNSASFFAVSDGNSLCRRGRPGYTPPFPQSHPTTNFHPLGVLQACSPPSLDQTPLQVSRRAQEAELGCLG